MFVIAEGGPEGPCVCCGGENPREGPGLRTTQGQPVCRECGRHHAPTLAALLDLAHLAQRIGRVQGHAPLRVSMEALLELARVSERYYLLVSTGTAA